ncbi:MAG TPA: GntR family transcriptional regulator [Streptosporangiaceae bacterium]|nr:GntR family transcriptional regulator [Streptosporangiaceae bacterium]
MPDSPANARQSPPQRDAEPRPSPQGPQRPPPAAQPKRGATRLRSVRSRQLADRLREEILAGSFASGSLPDEQALSAAYGSTRNTVRDALRLLVAEGLLVRRPGLGTRIAARKFAHSLDRLAGLAETLLRQGTIANEVRVARLEPASPPTARRLQIDDGATVLYLERLRLLDGEPLSLDCSYIAAGIGRALLTADLRSRDVFTLIEEIAATPLGAAEVTVQAVNASPGIAATLGVTARDAVFAIDRLTRLADGRPVDLESIYLRGDRISFTSVLHRSPGPSSPGPMASSAGDRAGQRHEGRER